MLLFAYGTLQNPVKLAAVIGAAATCRVVADASVQGRLYDAGDYPVLCRSDAAADRVPGLLLELDDAVLPRLDAYEGVAEGLYTRQRCTVELGSGEAVEAWAYVYARSVAGLPRIAAWPRHRG